MGWPRFNATKPPSHQIARIRATAGATLVAQQDSPDERWVHWSTVTVVRIFECRAVVHLATVVNRGLRAAFESLCCGRLTLRYHSKEIATAQAIEQPEAVNQLLVKRAVVNWYGRLRGESGSEPVDVVPA